MTDLTQSRARAEAFAALHVPGRPVVLPNAWDAASARIIEQAGAAAIATSSAGVSWSLGRADGNGIGRDAALAALGRIAAAVAVPVTADIETGYGDTDEDLAVTVRGMLDAGAVGINIEDSGGDPLWPLQMAAHRIQVARAAADLTGVPMYLNARVDVYWAGVGEPEGRLAETLRRAATYLAAGASGIFVPGVADLELVSRLTAGIGGPVNVLAGPAGPSVAQFAQAGIARISTGSSLGAATFGWLRRSVTDLLATGSFSGLTGGIGYGEMNGLFADR